MTQELHHEQQLGELKFRNDSGEVIPPFAVMQVTGATKVNGKPVLQVTKPNGSGKSYLINGGVSVPASNGYGRASAGWSKRAALASNYSAGDECGPVSGQWTLSTDGSGWIVVGDVASATGRVRMTSSAVQDEVRGEFVSYTNAGTSGNTYGIITLKATSPAPLALPTGTPPVEGTILVADVHLLGASAFTAGMKIRAIHSVAIDTLGAAQIDWEHLPTAGAPPPKIVQVYHPTLADGEAVDPIHESLDRIFKGSFGGTDNIWIESIDTPANDNVRSSLPAAGQFIGLYAGTYNPHDDESEATDQERPLYQVQPQHVGVVLGLITSNNSSAEADWSTPTIPVAATITCTLYRHEEDGTLSVWKTGVSVKWMVEEAAVINKIVYLSRMEGFWHVTSQLCATASGAS